LTIDNSPLECPETTEIPKTKGTEPKLEYDKLEYPESFQTSKNASKQ
jgi:hypothetical protein